ncbi:hypothetical protein HWV07_04305 [Natronomonas salina]|uniref:hypothetical protein n=1 Tax=Natronomonas salina TaxID=1710540 RepID=UPI0015B57481|nr:hypothetical protein [Natronomonas salina]QLD88296.1 hypothetical protein HWV07_04305 [Natronomonas salina]
MAIYDALLRIPWYIAVSILLSLTVLIVSATNLYMSHFQKKRSDVRIRQRFQTGAVIMQEKRLDIDLFLYAENRGDLNAKLAYGGVEGEVTFHGPIEEKNVESSELDHTSGELQFNSPNEGLLPPSHGCSLVLRLSFQKEGRMRELIYDYERAEIPWTISVTEGKRDYRVTGRATVRLSNPTSVDE